MQGLMFRPRRQGWLLAHACLCSASTKTPSSLSSCLCALPGLNPLEDCGDSFAWYGFGTYAASIIGGKTLGVAKNATIHSGWSAGFGACCDNQPIKGSTGGAAAVLIGGMQCMKDGNVNQFPPARCPAVRFRGSCLIDDVGTLTPEGLPAAIASVVANHTKPAVMVIDSW